MKSLWPILSALTVLITLTQWLGMPTSLQAWRAALEWVPAWLSGPFLDVAPAILGLAGIVAALLTLALGAWGVLIVLLLATTRFFVASIWIKGIFGMTEWVSRNEAEAIIEQSGFFNVRRKAENPVASLFSLKSIYVGGKQGILEKGFISSMMRKFEESRPSAVKDGRYNRAILEDWLSALLEREVKQEMGDIPDV